MELSSTAMVIGTFNIRTTKSKVVKTGDGTDVAARYFVYKLYEATDGQPMQWQVLLGMEHAPTLDHRRRASLPALLTPRRRHRYPLWSGLCVFGISDALQWCQQFASNDLTSPLPLVACS
jgi:hypothetical protein